MSTRSLNIRNFFTRRDFLKMGVASLAAVPFTAHATLPAAESNSPAGVKAGSASRQSAELSNPTVETRLLMGTFVSVSLTQASAMAQEEAMGQAWAEAERLIPIFSRFDANSALSALNSTGSLDCPPELAQVLASSLHYGQLTEHAFNVGIKPLLDLFTRYQNPAGSLTIPDAELAAARSLVQPNSLLLSGTKARLDRPGMSVTLDGIAKGAIVDAMSAALTRCQVPNHLINAGGDIFASGEKTPGKAWQVAVQVPPSGAMPARAGQFFSAMPLKQRALATSGNYENSFDASRRHHHLIQPFTGQSPVETVSVSVLAPTTAQADALATALSVMPMTAGLQLISTLPGCEALFVSHTGTLTKSAGWQLS